MTVAQFAHSRALALLVSTVAFLPSARADEQATSAPQPATPFSDVPKAVPREQQDKPVRIGVLGGVGFPRPLALEAMVKLRGVVGLGVEGSFLPALTIEGVSTSVWSIAGDARVFPFHGAFFLGLRGGYQHLGASTTLTVASLGSAAESAELNSVYVNPRLGLLWTMRSGFTIGIEAGAQIPLTSSFSTTLPDAVAQVVRQSPVVTTLSGVLPTVDLLRIGGLF